MNQDNNNFDEVDRIIIRERLCYYFNKVFYGRDRSSLVKEIVASEATIYYHREIKTNKKERYDTYIDLKDDTVARFLDGETSYLRRTKIGDILVDHVVEFFKFLVEKYHMHTNEVGQASQKHIPVFPIIVSEKDHEKRKYIKALKAGEYVRENQTETQFQINGLTIAKPSKQFVALTRHICINFERASVEGGQHFTERVERGQSDSHLEHLGYVLAKGNNHFLLAEYHPKNSLGIIVFYFMCIRDDFVEIHRDDNKHIYSNTRNMSLSSNRRYFESKKYISKYLFDVAGRTIDSINFGVFMNDENERLIEAAKQQDIAEMYRALIDGADINYQSSEGGWTALHWVAHYASMEALAALSTEDELPNLTQAVILKIQRRFPDNEAYSEGKTLEERWRTQIIKLNALTRGNDGYLASARSRMDISKRGDPAHDRIIEFTSRLMGLESSHAQKQGLNPISIHVEQLQGRPVSPQFGFSGPN